jgi:hypothetical protein
VVEVV